MSKVTVAEKLSAIGNNMARVYDTGFEKGFDKGRDEGFEKGHNQGFEEGRAEGFEEGRDQGFEEGKQFGDYGQGFEEGKQAEYNAFWDVLQNKGQRTNYSDAFANWECEYIRPKYKVEAIDAGSGVRPFYYNSALKKVESEYFDFSNKLTPSYASGDWYYSFYNCKNLEEIEDIGIIANAGFYFVFSYCPKLHTIAKITLSENTVIERPFVETGALENITIEGVIGQNIDLRWSTKLTYASIKSIIEHLSDTASGKTLTLSKTAVDNAFLFGWEGGDVPGTDETNPVWPPLRDSKPNWTITLV
jgi:hypothetical protein